ncbi:hypothetical protein E4U19_007041 [Claviceps sp. Clav32 group G5]|nr:hypothetical protein E4U19_007041 [Claviceps sp. Clav32 group G5]KAG6045206.1 hypothetical protein E4U39_002622 [Claviceps sp. Clav50 group G5]
MHVLGSIGHGFGQRRKNSSPKNLNIRKISLPCLSTSGSSSFSSSSSTMSAPEPSSARSRTGSHGFGPLSLHPTFHQQQQQPPPRLHDRPLISPRQKDQYEPPSFFHDDDFAESADEEDFDDRQTVIGDDEEYTFCRAQVLHFSHCPQPKEMILSSSPRTSAVDHETMVDVVDGSESRDYYMRQLAKRPAMPCSRWSDSTIQTLDFVDIAPDETLSDEDDEEDTEEDVEEEEEKKKEEVCIGAPMPNFSRKRITTPSRPPLRSLDSLDDFMKKSGWKRRGVIFDRSEARQHSVDF